MTAFNSMYNTISTFVLKYLNFDNIFYILIGVVAFSVLVGAIFGKRTCGRCQRKHDNKFMEEMHDEISSASYSYRPGNIFYND